MSIGRENYEGSIIVVRSDTSRFSRTTHGDYWMLDKVDRHGQHQIATDSDVVPIMRSGHVIPFALSGQARQAGAVDLVVDTFHDGRSAQVHHQMLAERFYQGKSVVELSSPAWIGGLFVFAAGMVLAVRRKRSQRRLLTHGNRLKGPQIVTVKEFN
jgi:hypothetical protein